VRQALHLEGDEHRRIDDQDGNCCARKAAPQRQPNDGNETQIERLELARARGKRNRDRQERRAEKHERIHGQSLGVEVTPCRPAAFGLGSHQPGAHASRSQCRG
jgi:hypothetical protein